VSFVRNRFILAADLGLIVLSAFVAFALRFDLAFVAKRPEFLPFLAAALVVKPAVFFSQGMYRRFWRYASLNDMLVVALSVSIASVLLAVLMGVAVAFKVVVEFSRAVLLMDWLVTLVTVAGIRAAVRIAGESHQKGSTGREAYHRRVLVVGAGEAGAMVVREMRRNPHLEMEPVGFLDDDAVKRGKRIHGTPVMGSTSDLEGIVSVARVDEVLIAMPRASGAAVRAVSERTQALGVRCRIIPGVFELLDGQVSISRLRQVEISDLLRRDQVDVSTASSAYLVGRTVLVTGAGGSIGSELCRQVAHARPRTLVMLGHGENSIFESHREISTACPDVQVIAVLADIRDENRMSRVMQRIKPDVVFHAAAHKHVPLMEANPQEAISNNVIGTMNVLAAAVAAGVERFVMISTDKAVAPANVMGASKRLAEMLVRETARRTGRAFVVVRFGNVLGSRGSVVPSFKRQIEQGGPITITHPEMRRFFMTIPEAVHLVIQAGRIGRGSELFVLNMGEPVRIVDLAEDLIRLSGFQRHEIPIVYTGLRPGEKLDESLWEAGSVLKPVDYPDLLCVTEPDDPSSERLAAAVETLKAAVAGDDRMKIEWALATCIASYTPPLAPPTRLPARPQH
jgi:FlaA1/EpsC-like NDP-sugar epimerase